MRFKNNIYKYILTPLFLLLFSSCNYNESLSLPNQSQFNLKIHKIHNNFFLVWPLQISTLPKSEDNKLKELVEILSKANDVDIEITPIYKTHSENDNEKVSNRAFLIRDILYGFGIPFNKIFIKHKVDPKKYEEGFIIKIITYQLKIPNCSSFKNDGAKSLEESFQNFGCATVANFGKLIAYPSSLNKYQKTTNDRNKALKAITEHNNDSQGEGN